MRLEAIRVPREYRTRLSFRGKDVSVYADSIGIIQGAAHDGSDIRKSLERQGDGCSAFAAKIVVDQLAASFRPTAERSRFALREGDATLRKDQFDVQG